MEKLGYGDFSPNEISEDKSELAVVIDIAKERARRKISSFLDFQGRILSGEIPLHKRGKIENNK